MRWFNPARMMGAYAGINILLLAVAILHPGGLGAGAILLTSFFMSIMYPTIFAMGIKGLGQDTKLGGSLIVMSVVGAGIIPPILGMIAKRFGSYALGYTVVSACYLVVAIYGLNTQSRTNMHTVPTPI
jgi:FHS family L-fucose permease-like MFS transporter